MARQADYLASLLQSDTVAEPPQATPRRAASTLLSRESALARVSSGEVRQVTQLLIDPARVRIWAGNARIQAGLTEENCRDLIDSIISEGGQRVPAIVRRLDDAEGFDYEVIAGTRRHFAVSWLRANAYPEMQLLAQVQNLDDEAAFRLADLENRARRDVSDLERARNYAAALSSHYGGHQTRMAERLRLSKGWLSKMLKVATLPECVVEAFASVTDVQLKPAYTLACALDDKGSSSFVLDEAKRLASEQEIRHQGGLSPIVAGDVFRRLMAAYNEPRDKAEHLVLNSHLGRPMLAVQGSSRQGFTVRIHAGSGASRSDLIAAFASVVDRLEGQGRSILG